VSSEKEVKMKRRVLVSMGLVVLMGVSAPGVIPSPLPHIQFQTTPSSPTSSDEIVFGLSGTWPDGCAPNATSIGIMGPMTIGIDLLLPNVGASDCNALVCSPSSSAWQINSQAGPFPAGTYNVYVRAVGCNQAGTYEFLAQLHIGSSGGTTSGGLAVGQRVVLLQNNPPGGTGLMAGQSGTVICCDTNDCSGSVLVSWDFWTSAKPSSTKCANDPGTLYPANSAIWVDPSQVLLGVFFNQCGTIGNTVAGCVYLAGDDGNTYSLMVTGDQYIALDSAGSPVRFGSRARVRGLLNTTPPAPGVIRICPQQSGDIYNPIISPCVTPSGSCCTPSYSPGDRVVLLVSDPVGQGGKIAAGLPAGTLGTVVCCDGSDPDFPIFVSWDGYTNGTSAPCNSTITYPSQSGLWMACGQIIRYHPSLPGPITINLGGNPLILMVDPNAPGPGYSFSGCTNVSVELNSQVQLSVQVTPASGVGGTWTGTVTPSIAGPGTVPVQICVQVVNLDISTLPSGNNVQVATVELYAVPYP
jgi:hypothetical protein